MAQLHWPWPEASSGFSGLFHGGLGMRSAACESSLSQRKRESDHTVSPKKRMVVSDLSNMPDYMPGDFCFTEPCTEPQHGCMMEAYLPSLGISIFAACIVVGSDFELVPLKAGYPTFSSKTDDIELLAVAVEHHKDLRNR